MATKKKAKKGKPAKQAASSPARAPNGQLLPGHTANPNGRPKGIVIREAVEDIAEEKGIDLRQAAYEVMEAQRLKALEGDTQAAKLWMDRLGGLLTQGLEMTTTQEVAYIPETAHKTMLDNASDPAIQAAQVDIIRNRTNGKA